MDTRPPGGGSKAGAADPWRLVAPGHSWNDLVIPDPQRESLKAITSELLARGDGNGDSSKHTAGPVVLFAGPVGTGKTMAARIIAATVGMSVLEVDTTALRARDRAGVERRVGQVFGVAKDDNAIVFFEHADAVLGERPVRGVHHARPGVVTAPDLFERAERHPGLVIFASTLRGKIDPAYRERFGWAIEFPFPDGDARRRLWHQLLPRDASLTQADIDGLARSFQLPGAAIAACCAAAVDTALEHERPVGLLDVAEAVQAEYRGRLASESTRAAVADLLARARQAQASSALARELDAPVRNGVPLAPAAVGRRPGLPDEHRLDRRRVGFGLLSAAAIVAALAIGFGAAQLTVGTQTARASQAAAGPVHVSLPAGWRVVHPTRSSLGLANELMLAASGSRAVHLTIGTLPTSDSALLPSPVLASVRSVPPAQIATLGPVSFYRFPDLVSSETGRVQSFYSTPTTIGTLVGTCNAPTSDAAAMGDCERILSTVRLASGSVLGTAAGVSYAGTLNAVINQLNAIRARAGTQLATARTAASQAQAARQLATADATAALSVSKLSPGFAGATNSRLAAALRTSAAAYGALASAAARGDAPAYAAARTSVASAEAALNAAFGQLSALGYRVA